ncbi:MAG: hypothetical protein ACRYFY_20530 [Janthinobacterium lividum]
MTITYAFSDPSVTGPNFLFNNEKVSGVEELYNTPTDSALGGIDHTWAITQWSSSELFTPSNLSATVISPLLGTSVANWQTPDGDNGFTVFGKPGNYIYELKDVGGSLKDVYLGTTHNAPLDYTFDKQVTFSVDERIAAIVGTSNEGPTSLGNSFTVAFNRQGSATYDSSLPTISMFLQFGLADQRGLPESLYGNDMYNVAPGANNTNQALYFVADNTMHHVTIDLSAAVSQMIAAMYSHQYTSSIAAAGQSILDLSRWSLTSEYIGPESIGNTGVTMDVSDPVISRDDSITVDQSVAAADKQVVSVVGGVNYTGEVDGSDPASSTGQPIPKPFLNSVSITATGEVKQISDISADSALSQLTVFDPFFREDLVATVTLVNNTGGVFDISGLPSALTHTDGFGVASLSQDGRTVTISGAFLQSNLEALKFIPARQLTGTTSTQAVSLMISDATGTVTAYENITIVGSLPPLVIAPPLPPPYTFDGMKYVISSDANSIATIYHDSTDGPVTVVGGAASLVYTGGNATIELDQIDQTGTVSIHSTSGNVVLEGSTSVDYQAGGASRFVTGDQSGSIYVHGGTSADTNEFDISGSSASTRTIVTDGISSNTIFGGRSNIDYTGGHSLIVLNGADQTGRVVINSEGNNTVWSGSSQLDFREGSGNDTVILSGVSETTVVGSSKVEDGVTTVQNYGNSGSFMYDGGFKASSLNLANGQNTVFGGWAQETVSMSGTGSLIVADGVATGKESITTAGGFTGKLEYWGGAADANISLGGGSSYVMAGTGNTSLSGGTGLLTLDLKSAVNFTLDIDGLSSGKVDMFNYNPAFTTLHFINTAATLLVGGNMVMTLHDGATITIHDYSSVKFG